MIKDVKTYMICIQWNGENCFERFDMLLNVYTPGVRDIYTLGIRDSYAPGIMDSRHGKVNWLPHLMLSSDGSAIFGVTSTQGCGTPLLSD